MKTTRIIAVITLSVAVLALWGCPAEQAEDQMPGDGMGMNGQMGEHMDGAEQMGPGEHMDGDHEAGEHMNGDHAAGENMDGVEASEAELSGTVVAGTRVVEVEAKRYEFIPSPIVVTAGQPVRLEITATDVTHGFGLDDFGIDQALPPNETQTVEFTPEEPGEYHYHCTHYCGPGHDEMHGTLIVKE